jgi:hypothetical protein
MDKNLTFFIIIKKSIIVNTGILPSKRNDASKRVKNKKEGVFGI